MVMPRSITQGFIPTCQNGVEVAFWQVGARGNTLDSMCVRFKRMKLRRSRWQCPISYDGSNLGICLKFN